MIGAKVLVGIGIAIGAGLSGVVGGAAYWVQGAELKLARAKTVELEAAINAAGIKAAAEAAAAQLVIDGLQTDLAHSHKMRRIEYVTVEKRLAEVASPTRVAARAEPVRVFNSAQAIAAVRRHRASIAAGAVPTAAANPNGSTSELGMMTWAWSANDQYEELAETHFALAAIVRRAPCIRVK